MYVKSIAYDRETRDYAMYLDGELVGFGRTYHEAEITLDQLVFELMTGQHFPLPVDIVPPVAPESACAGFGCVDGCGDCDALTTSIITTMVRSGLSADDVPTDAPGDDCPDHGPYGDDDCPKCLNCRNPHHTWQCPEIHALLRAEPVVMVMDVEHAPVGWPI